MANRTVLLIDYEPRSIEDTRRPLEEAGFAVEVAHDGVAGLEAFYRVHPDLVLVEAMLPKKHGFDVCQEIKNSADGKDTPVVITTGVYRGRKYRAQALQNFGCDEYLEKPFTDDALLDACNRFIAREIADSPGAPAESTAEPLTVDPDADPASDDNSTGALELERMTEDEISSRLDTLLADFGEAVDAAVEPSDEDPSIDAADEAAAAPAPSDRESIFETDARVAADEAAAVDLDPPPIDLPIEDEVTSVDAPAGPASAVFAVSAGTADAAPGDPATEQPDVIPIVPVEARSPVQDMPVGVDLDADLRGETEVRKPPTKSTVLADRPADPTSRRWLVPVVAVVVVGAVVTGGAIWMTSRPTDDGTPAAAAPAPVRERVTFESSTAARAGFADDAPVPTVDGLGSPTDGAEQGLAAEIDPTVSAPESIAAAPVAEPVDGPAVRVRDQPPVPVPRTASDPPTRAASDRSVAASKPNENIVQPEPDPAPAMVAAPVAVAAVSPAATVPPPPTEQPRSTETAVEVPAVVAPATAAVAAAEVVEPVERSTEPEPTVAATEPAPVAAAPVVPEPPPVRAGDLVEIAEVDTEPVAISKPAPRYNAVAKQAKQQGDVVLNVLIDENGAVTDVNVLKGIEGSMLDDAAIRAVRKWTYEPATKDGVPVQVWTMEIISFRL